MGLGRSVALSRSLAGSAEGAGSPALLAPNEWAVALRRLSQETAPPTPSPFRTDWTRLVLPPVLIGHAASLSQETGQTLVAASAGLSRRFDAPAQPFWDLSSQSGLNVCAPSPCCPAPPRPAPPRPTLGAINAPPLRSQPPLPPPRHAAIRAAPRRRAAGALKGAPFRVHLCEMRDAHVLQQTPSGGSFRKLSFPTQVHVHRLGVGHLAPHAHAGARPPLGLLPGGRDRARGVLPAAVPPALWYVPPTVLPVSRPAVLAGQAAAARARDPCTDDQRPLAALRELAPRWLLGEGGGGGGPTSANGGGTGEHIYAEVHLQSFTPTTSLHATAAQPFI